MNGLLDRLIEYTAKHFTFDEGTYPELAGASEEQRLKFALRHMAIHFSKTAGKIAGVCDKMDHGKEASMEELKENIPKAFINTIRLAGLIQVMEKDIIRALEEKYKERI
jgi:restriction endonuclease Mrr